MQERTRIVTIILALSMLIFANMAALQAVAVKDEVGQGSSQIRIKTGKTNYLIGETLRFHVYQKNLFEKTILMGVNVIDTVILNSRNEIVFGPVVRFIAWDHNFRIAPMEEIELSQFILPPWTQVNNEGKQVQPDIYTVRLRINGVPLELQTSISTSKAVPHTLKTETATTAVVPRSPAEVGYGYSGYHWNLSPGSAITYFINVAGTADVPGTGEFAAVQAGFQTWENDGASYIDYTYGGTTAAVPETRDSTNVVGWRAMGNNGIIAMTTFWPDSNKVIQEADLTFNDTYLWSITGAANAYDVQNIGTHEAGHYLCLDDLYGTEDNQETMYGIGNLGEIIKRTLEWGDTAGVRYIYPNRPQVGGGGIGWYSQGGDVAIGQINGAGGLDYVMAWVDNPSGDNYLRYRCGWDISASTGEPSSWSSTQTASGWVGTVTAGLGAALVNLDATSQLELVLLWVDDPSGANTIYYKIGWNLNTAGTPTSWSSQIAVPSSDVGSYTAGAAVTFANLDANSRPEMIVCWVDDPSGANTIYYKVGWNINTSGNAASWGTKQSKPGWVGDSTSGAGAVLTNLGGGTQPDLVVFWIDNPSGANHGNYQIGWDVKSDGTVTSWSELRTMPGDWQFVGDSTAGCGVTAAQIALTSRPELIFMWIDDPIFDNPIYYRLQWEVK